MKKANDPSATNNPRSDERCSAEEMSIPESVDEINPTLIEDGESCPVCGQPYVHKKEVRGESDFNLRSDFTACEQEQSETVERPRPNGRTGWRTEEWTEVFVHKP